MAKFIPNAVMLYKEPGPFMIESRLVDCKMFDKDSATFDEDSEGWKTFEEIISGESIEAPRRGRPPKAKE